MPEKLPPEELRKLNSMCHFIEMGHKYKIKPTVLFDIGAYNAEHTKELSEAFSIPRNKCWAFEPHPGMYEHCVNRGVNVLPYAISDFDGNTDFYAVDLTAQCHHGTSSLFKIGRPHNILRVNVFRIDTLISNNLILIPDIVKLDVEGKSYEVLQGFGTYLEYVKIWHIECEMKEYFPGQKLETDIVQFMKKHGYDSVHRLQIGHDLQADHIFVRKDIIHDEKE